MVYPPAMASTGSASKHGGTWQLAVQLSRIDRDMLQAGQAIEVVVSADDAERTVFNVILHPAR